MPTSRQSATRRKVPGAAKKAAPGRASSPAVIVIGHRGASGYVPEHTLTSYFLAIQQGADYAEPDLVMTKDGVLVARHENEIGGTTDVADHAGFARRRTAKRIDGVEIEGWFTEDFTLAELKTLRARERIPEVRPANTRFDGQFEIPTFDEILGLIRAMDVQRAAAARRLRAPKPRPIGVYPETKHPTYFDQLGLSMDRPLLQTLARHGYAGRTAPVFIQSFEVGNLKRLRLKTKLPMVQLIEAEGAPFDFVAAGELPARGRRVSGKVAGVFAPRRRSRHDSPQPGAGSYADLITPAGLAAIARYANAIGPNKSLIIPRNADATLGSPTALVADAHAAGLGVHPWTFRAENHFLPANFCSSSDPTHLGDLATELRAYLATGIDGFFTDHPNLGAAVCNDPSGHRRVKP